MIHDFIWALPLTCISFLSMHRLSLKINKPYFNPLLMSMLIIIPVLLMTHTSYERYFAGNRLINELLPYGVVALAYPLYKQLPQIMRRWKTILTICFLSSCLAMITGFAIAKWAGASYEIAASILPKSVTTPIALAIAEEIHGINAIVAMCVIYVGILGALIGHALMNRLGIRHKIARGMAIGSASHVIGAARCAEVDWEEGAFSSLALVLCGVFTAFIAPILVPILVRLFF